MAARQGYSTLQIALHWIIVALVVFQLLVNNGMADVYNARIDGEAETMQWAILHVSVGVSILLLAIIRLIVRLRRGAPPIHRDKPNWLIWLAGATHVLLYGFIILMPLTGALAWFGLIEVSGELHELGRWALIPLIVLHAAGGLAEHFYFKNDSLVRMLKPEAAAITWQQVRSAVPSARLVLVENLHDRGRIEQLSATSPARPAGFSTRRCCHCWVARRAW
jgi:cytochrome b561